MDIADLRRAVDIEFGMATYEPFGISPLEPLGCGAICVISNVCGCEGFVRHVAGRGGVPNVITADFTTLDQTPPIEELLTMTAEQRDEIEAREAERVAEVLMQHLPFDDAARKKLISAGQALVAKMGWDQVIEEGLLPMLDRICNQQVHVGA
jgi:hypothetical protein